RLLDLDVSRQRRDGSVADAAGELDAAPYRVGGLASCGGGVSDARHGRARGGGVEEGVGAALADCPATLLPDGLGPFFVALDTRARSAWVSRATGGGRGAQAGGRTQVEPLMTIYPQAAGGD